MITHSYVKLGEEFESNSGDMWVRAHSKETPLTDWLKREIPPVELKGLNDITSS